MESKKVAGFELTELPGDPGGATILLLHGFGATAGDLIPLSGIYREHPRPTWLFPSGPLEIPITPEYTGRAWFPLDMELLQTEIEKAFPPELVEIRQQLERLIGELEIPRSKLIIGGFSQGAVLAIETALNGVERVGGLLIFSGTLINEPTWSRQAHHHAGTPFFQSHGKADPLLPYAGAEKLEKLLAEGGLKGSLHPFSGGHEIPQKTMVELYKFLKSLLS